MSVQAPRHEVRLRKYSSEQRRMMVLKRLDTMRERYGGVGTSQMKNIKMVVTPFQTDALGIRTRFVFQSGTIGATTGFVFQHGTIL